MTDLIQQEYNKYEYLDQVPYKVVEYLIENNDLLWKLLYYNSADAWASSKSNLSNAQKGALVYDGLKNETDCKVFLDFGQDESWTEQVSMLRVSVVDVTPATYLYGHLAIGFEVYVHYKIATLSNYRVRSDMIIQQLIETLNGADLGLGIGRLYFNYEANRMSKVRLIGNAPFKGRSLILCNHNF